MTILMKMPGWAEPTGAADRMSREEDFRKMEEDVKACKRCGLRKTRKNPVPGEGSLSPEIMFIGEAPGFNEDVRGRPFVGRAGKLLDELLESIDLKREDVFIGNILKCRPPKNRDPQPEEIKACSPYLDRQIALLKPRIICTLGNFSTSYVLEKFGIRPDRIGKIHGEVFPVHNLMISSKIVPIHHPAAALRNPELKSVLMEDFRVLKGLTDKKG